MITISYLLKQNKTNNGANQNLNNCKTSSASLTFLSVDQENFGVLQIKLWGKLDISSRLSHLTVYHTYYSMMWELLAVQWWEIENNLSGFYFIYFTVGCSALKSWKTVRCFFSEVISLFSSIFMVGCLLYVWEKVTSKDIIPVLKHEHFEI